MADQCVALEEQGHLSDFLSVGIGARSMIEVARVSDAFRIGRRSTIGEAGAIADAVKLVQTAEVREEARIQETVAVNSKLSYVLLESGHLQDRFTYLPVERISEQGRINDALRLGCVTRLVERGELADAAFAHNASTVNTMEQGRLRDVLRLYQWATVEESGRAQEAISIRVSAHIAEAGQVNDYISIGGSASAAIVETFRGTDSYTTRVDAFATVMERGCVEDAVVPPASGAAWTANTDSWAASRYAGFGIESLAIVGGKLYGAGTGGLYAIDGDDDAGTPIAGAITTGQYRSKGAGVPRGGYLYAPMQAARAMQVSVLDTAAGTPSANTYPFEARHADGLAQMRAKFGKGVRSLTWQFQVGNVDGGAFSIPSGMNWVIDPGTRRV